MWFVTRLHTIVDVALRTKLFYKCNVIQISSVEWKKFANIGHKWNNANNSWENWLKLYMEQFDSNYLNGFISQMLAALFFREENFFL